MSSSSSSLLGTQKEVLFLGENKIVFLGGETLEKALERGG